MAIYSFRSGPCAVQYPTSVTTSVPSLTTVAFTASAVTLSDSLYNSIENPLTVGTSYNVCLALIGEDRTTGGWSVGRATTNAGPLTVAAGEGIQIRVPLANWPANYQYAAFVGVFLQTGTSGPYQFCKAVPITTFDQANDFYTIVAMAPPSLATQFTLANLQSTGNPLAQKDLGDRTPTGFTYTTFLTTGDIVITYEAGSSVTFSPNLGSDFTVVGARVLSVQFSVLANDVKTIAQSAAGDYMVHTGGGHTYYEGQFGINTASVIVKGPKPLLVTPPVDPSTGVAEQMLFCSLLLQNQQQVAMAWSKKNQTPVPFQFQTVSNDALFNNQPTMYTRAIV